MKKVLSLVLSLVMAFSIITGMDVSVFAADTEVESYNIYKADRYAEAFDNIFVGTDSSSYARTFYNNLLTDDLLMGEIVAWESLHMIASPSYSLDSGVITKYDYFKTVLFDLIISKSEDTIATKAQDNFEYLFDQVKNSKNSFIVSTAKKISSSKEGLTIVKLKETKLTDAYKSTILNSTRFADSMEVASDVMQILEWCDNVYDAIELTSNYCALADVYDGTKEVLQYIANDTRNNEDVRLAATNCIECMGDSYTEIVNAMCIGSFSLFIDVGLSFVSETWKYILATIPGGQVVAAAMIGLQGGRAIVNLLMSQDDKTKAYYQIEANVICEDAIIRAVSGLKDAYLNNKTEENAVIYLRAVEMYKDDILLGFDYSIDLLEVLVEANLSVIIGTYNKGITLINDLYSYKSQKLNNFITFEDVVNTAYINTYMPDYNSVINDFNNQEVVEVESISLTQIKDINIGDTGHICNYIDVIKYPENANDLFVEKFVSLNEDVIKLNEYYFIEVVGAGRCTIVCNQGTEFEQSITVTVGDMPIEDTYDYLSDFSYAVNSDTTTASITKYTGTQSNVIIPGFINGYKITSIGYQAFYGCKSLASVVIPDTVTSIGNSAFDRCTGLTSVTIGKGVKSIGEYAFYLCAGITSIVIPDSVKSIGREAFCGCVGLTSVSIGSSVSSVGYNAFNGCGGINSVYIKDVAKWCAISFGSVAANPLFDGGKLFLNNELVTNLVVPDNTTTISNYAFYKCSSLTSAIIGNGVTKIGELAFYNCTNLVTATIPEGVTSIGYQAFYGCKSLASVVIPDTATSIGNSAFDRCTGLTTVIIGDGVTSIGEYAFYNCNNIKYVFFPRTSDDFKKISIGKNNTCLTNANIHYGNKIHVYGDWVVTSEPNCNEAGTKSKTCSTCGDVVNEVIPAHGHDCSTEWIIDVTPTCTEVGSKSHHCNICGVKTDVTTIAALGHNYVITSVASVHPHTITYNCTCCGNTKKEVPFSSSCIECNFTITAIDSGSCKLTSYIGSETNVVIPSKHKDYVVTTVGNSCFKNNSTIECVIIPSSITSISSLAFMNCSSLGTIFIPASVTSIGTQAFYGFTGTIYCTSGSYAHEYAVANNIKYVIETTDESKEPIQETVNTQIDYDNFIIRSNAYACKDISEILGLSESAVAVAEASYIYGNLELYGTGTIITVFDGNKYVGDFTLIVEGDTNGDSVCDALDAAKVALASNGHETLDGAYALAADSNFDDIVDINDYQQIVNKAVS